MTRHVAALVVGGGITGLAAAHRLAQAGHTDWLLLEREPSLGGKIRTDRAHGHLIEAGPDCFLASKPGGIALCRDLGIDGQLIETSPAYRRSYVRRAGRLHELPSGFTGLVPTRLTPLFRSSVLSLRGRLRAALEVIVPRRAEEDDESIAAFVSRRFGQEAYDWLIEPLVSGIFAGNGHALSLAATFPRLAEIERRHRSVIGTMLLGRRDTATDRSANGRPTPGFVTLADGMGTLVAAIARRLPDDRVRLGADVHSLSPRDDGFAATLADGTTVTSSSVILAVPAHIATLLVRQFDPLLAERLREIPFVSTATVSVALPRASVPQPLDGYGFVSPRAEGGPVVACTWTSNKFAARAPEGGVLIRFYIGRAGDDAIVDAPDREIQRLVRSQLSLLGITHEPSHWWIHRWPGGMPQYTLGHVPRVTGIASAAARHPGLLLAGASYRGVGIPDCIDAGRHAADQVLATTEAAAS